MTTPSPGGRMWTVRLLSTANEQERALRATADAHERRFSALTERSPIPTLLSEQGMRLAHVNDAFCTLVGLRAEQLLGTGWMDAVHPDDLDDLIEDRKSTRLNSSHANISYAVFCLKKKKTTS